MRYIVILCVIIFSALGAMYFWIGTPGVYSEQFVEFGDPHLYNDPARKIAKIKIAAFYFVPKNKTEELNENWKDILQGSLKKLHDFHSVQLQARSNIEYEIYPNPIIGFKNNIDYDTESTQAGNPQALLNISEELEKRVFKSSGDLYNSSFFNIDSDELPVLAIMYEGVGAVGGMIYEDDLETRGEIAQKFGLPEHMIHIVDIKSVDGFFLINRVFLSELEYQSTGPSIFAHEFYHTLGIPDEYKEYKAIPTSEDIMGLGRFRPIEKTYIDKDTLKKLGL